MDTLYRENLKSPRITLCGEVLLNRAADGLGNDQRQERGRDRERQTFKSTTPVFTLAAH
jgi:hypothetical protein